MIIQSRNTLDENAPKTFLTNNEVSGTNVLRWKNPSGFILSWGIQVGETGEEQTEVLILSTGNPSGGTAGTTTANSLYEHPANTPVYAIKYNQVVFERSTSGTAGTATPMTNGTLTYQADHKFTQFDDTSGSSTYGYRTYFRSSVLEVNTTESDWWTPAGLSFYSLGKLRERTKGKLWNADFLTDGVIDDWTNEFKDKLMNAAIQSNEDYSLGTVDVGFGTAGLGTVTTTDFKQPRRLWVTYNGNDWYQSTKMDANDDYPDKVYLSTHPYHYWFGNDIFQVNPADSGGTARIMFYRQGTPMQNDTDELPLFMRGYTDSFVEYNLLQAQYKDNKLSVSEKKQSERQLIGDFVNQLAPRDKTGVDMIDIVESVQGYDNLP